MLLRVIPNGSKTFSCINSCDGRFVIASTTSCSKSIPSPEYANREPG